MSDETQELQDLLEDAPTPTRRPTVASLESELFHLHPVLDHGFVRVIDYMGGDDAVVQAARVSYGRGTRSTRTDRGLIRYLMRHHHTTPFEMCEIKFHIKLPIFVARQWIRHRMANINEYSARYSILSREFYIPEPGQVAVQSSTNRQGRGDALSSEDAAHVRALLQADAEQTYRTYEQLINDQGDGTPADPSKPQVARELARTNLTLSTYTQWYWKADLHNLLHFIALRIDPHAQYEIRVYAQAIADIVRAWVPHVWEAFEDYRMGGANFSAEELSILRGALSPHDLTDRLAQSKLSPREQREFLSRLDLSDANTNGNPS